MRTSVRSTFSVARKLMRDRSLAWSTTTVFVVAAVLLGMFISLKAFTLAGPQIVERDLGRYEGKADLSAAVDSVDPGDQRIVLDAAAAVRHAGAMDVMVSLTSLDLQPAMVDPPLTMYVEADWPATPFPQRYSLVDGRWPTRPGEVVLTEAARGTMPAGDFLPVLAGHARFRVVGVVHDRYSVVSAILAGQGTWATIDPAVRKDFATVSAYPTVYWNGAGQEPVVDALSAMVRKQPATTSPDKVTELIKQLTTSQHAEMTREQPSWAERFPLAYQIPVLALPLLSVLLILGLNLRRFRRRLDVLTAVGIRRSHAVAGVCLAMSGWTTVAAAFGALAGIGLGLLTRLVIAGVRVEPISPFPSVWSPVLLMLLVTTIACLLAALLLRPWPARQARTGERTNHKQVRVRHYLAVIAGAASVFQMSHLSTIAEAMILSGTIGATILLITPELIDVTARCLSSDKPQMRLAHRQLVHSRSRGATAVAVLTATLAAPIALVTLLAMHTASQDADLLPDAAPHQVVLRGTGSNAEPPPPGVVEAVTGRVTFAEPAIELRFLHDTTSVVGVRGAGIGSVLAVDTVDEIARLTNRKLTTAEADTLNRGGMLVWADDGLAERTLVVESTADGRISPVATIPAMVTTFEAAWRASVHGVTVTSTARKLALPVTAGALVYTNVPDADLLAAQRAVLDTGMDNRLIKVHEPPPPAIVPQVFHAAIIGLAVIALLTTMAVARAQVRSLRGYLGRLLAIGLPARWAKQVLVAQSAVIIGLSTALALAIAIPSMTVAAWRIAGLDLTVPWDRLGTIVGVFLITTLLATLLSSRRLRVH